MTDNENRAPPRKEPAAALQGKPPINVVLQPKDFRDITGDEFTRLFSKTAPPGNHCLTINLKSVLEMYSTEKLLNLSSASIVRTRGKRGASHTPSFYIFCFPSRNASNIRSLSQSIAKQLVELYTESFPSNSDDLDSFNELYDYAQAGSCQFHIALVVCKSTSDGTILATNCEVIAGLSCACDSSDGTVLKWIATNSLRLLTKDLVSAKKADNEKLQGRGIGTLLLVTLQAILEMCDYETRIFAEVNLEQSRPGSWYREKLYFAPVLRNQTLSPFISTHLLKDSSLVLYHSTIHIRDTVITGTFEDSVKVDSILVKAREILSSFGMPKRSQMSASAVEKFSEEEENRMQECMNEVVGNRGVQYADSLRSSPSPPLNRIYGNDDEVMGVWSKYVAAAPALKLRHIKTVELGTGDCKGVQGEKSCLYLCLSKAVLGSKKYYWRLRMAVAFAVYSFSFLRPTHPLMNSEQYMFFQVVQGIFDTTQHDSDTESEDGTDEVQKTLRALRRLAQKIMTGETDAGQLELNILSYLLGNIRMMAIQAYTEQPKPNRREKNQRRKWRCTLCPCGSGNEMFQNLVDRQQESNGGDAILLVHVENQHYVAMEFTDSARVNSSSHGEFGEFFIPFEEYVSDDEADTINVPKSLARFLGNELKEKARNGLYNFYPDEKNFNTAIDYVEERSTRLAEMRLAPVKKKKDKLDEEMRNLERRKKERTGHKKNTTSIIL